MHKRARTVLCGGAISDGRPYRVNLTNRRACVISELWIAANVTLFGVLIEASPEKPKLAGRS